MPVLSLASRIAPGVCGLGMLAYCPPTPTPATPTVPVSAFCSIIETENFSNPPLREAMSSSRTDAAATNHFTRMQGLAGSRNNPFISNDTDLYAVDEGTITSCRPRRGR
jgi:hypothetical protein